MLIRFLSELSFLFLTGPVPVTRDLCAILSHNSYFLHTKKKLPPHSPATLRILDTVHVGNKDHQLRFQTAFKVNLVIPNTKYWWFYSRHELFFFISWHSNIQLQILSQCKWFLALNMVLWSKYCSQQKVPLWKGLLKMAQTSRNIVSKYSRIFPPEL